jgi:hypothetical protein
MVLSGGFTVWALRSGMDCLVWIRGRLVRND